MRQTSALEAARDRLLERWALLTTNRPRLTIAACVLVGLLGLLLAGTRLEFKADRSDLIDLSLPWQQRYLAYKDAFPRWDDAVVVIDRQTGASGAADVFADALASALAGDARFGEALSGWPSAETPPGLVLSEPLGRVREIAGDLARTGPVLASPSLGELLGVSALGARFMDERSREDLAGLLGRIEEAGDGEGPVLGGAPERLRLATPSGRFAFVMVPLASADVGASVAVKSAAIRGLRSKIRSLLREPRFGGLEAGVTGVPVLEEDETIQSTRDATAASILATLLIAALSVVVYRGVKLPLMVIGSIVVGVAWSFGWATIAVGHLQVLSVVFMIVLVGLGSDMAVHLISRLEVVRPDHDHMGVAIRQAFLGAGPGILTGTFTTAAAFGATAFTNFAGVAELGLIAAGGIVLCTIVSMSMLPAMLMLVRRPDRVIKGRAGGVARPYMRGRLNWVDRGAPWAVGAWCVLLGLAGWGATHVVYDTDLLAMLPDTTESVRWERRLSADDERSAWHAVVVARSSPEAERLTRELRALPEVSDVGGAGILFPADVEEKQAALRALPAPELAEGEPTDFRPQAAAIASALAGSPAGEAADRVSEMTDEQAARAQETYMRERAALASTLGALRGASPVRADDLPRPIHEQVVGVDGSLLLLVYPKDDGSGASVLSPSRLTPFVRAVQSVAPAATGPTQQIYESARVIQSANIIAAALAAGVVLIVLMIDFRNIGDVLCAMLPVAAATAALLGLLGSTGVSLNFANTIVAPLLLGLGVTAGVHAVHRWRQQPADRPAGLAGGAGRAITMTLGTTLIGFASMLVAEHRGIRSLGFVMSAGLALVWAATTLLLPAVLRLRTRRP